MDGVTPASGRNKEGSRDAAAINISQEQLAGMDPTVLARTIIEQLSASSGANKEEVLRFLMEYASSALSNAAGTEVSLTAVNSPSASSDLDPSSEMAAKREIFGPNSGSIERKSLHGPIYIHTWTPVPQESALEAFARACEGGGSPPRWTQVTPIKPPRFEQRKDYCDSEEPLYVAHARVEGYMKEKVFDGLACRVTEHYESSGGRHVFLVDCFDSKYVVVARGESTSRIGASEQSMSRFLGQGDDCRNTVICE